MGTSSLPSPVAIRLPFAASSVAVARQRLQTWLQGQGWSAAAVEDARLVISELVANAVRHARPLPDGQILVCWCLDGRDVQISVTDGGGGTWPRNLNAPSSALAGRGMAIVDVLADRWWAERSGSRATVHALLHV